ncbi:MAG: hypothetical protein IIB03_07740 [Acidobacteria bacterium]|nr:hypothetical protein [Acidobacteriota bacterium]
MKTTESNIMLRSDVQAYFKDAVADMKKLHKEMKRENINPTVTYAKFIERVFKLQEITLRKDELIAARERARRAWKDMMKHPTREIMVERVGGIIEGVFGAEGGRRAAAGEHRDSLQ